MYYIFLYTSSESTLYEYNKKRFFTECYIFILNYDDKFVKMWEFYFASCAAAFRYRDLAVFQLQIVKNFQSANRTRDYIYS